MARGEIKWINILLEARMAKKWIGRFFVLYFLFCNFGYSTILFDCLREKNYPCLSREFNLDQKWHERRNQEGQSPLEFAILVKDPDLVRYLLKKSAPVEKAHVDLAMASFFEQELSREESEIEPPEELSIVERMLVAATRSKNPDQPMRLSTVIGLFGSKEEVAKSLNYLSTRNMLDDRQLNIYLSEYSKLFISNNAIEKNELSQIVKIIRPMNVDKFALLLISESSRRQEVKKKLTENYRINNFHGNTSIEQKMAYAIIEKSRKIYASLTPEKLVYEVINFEQSTLLKNAFIEGKNLTKFVERTISYPKQIENSDRNYKTWLQIYRILANNGDFMGAFWVGEALNSDAIKNIVSDNVFHQIDALNMDSNFANYRSQLSLFRKKFFIPSLLVLKQDIHQALLLNPFSVVEEHEVLNESTVLHLTKLREYLSKYNRRVHTRTYESTPEFNQLLEDLRFYDAKKWKHAYRVLWPVSKNNRSHSMRFEPREIFGSQLYPRKASYFEN